MMIATTHFNRFIEYALNLKSDPSSDLKLKTLIVENIKTISSNALTTSSVNLGRMSEINLLSLNVSTLHFEIDTGVMQTFSKTMLVYANLRKPNDPDPNTILDFIDFLISYLPSFSSLKIGNEEFSSYFFKQFKSLDYGLIYLCEKYRLMHCKSEENYVRSARENLKALANLIGFIRKMENREFYQETGSFLSQESIYSLLKLERFANLQTLMELGKSRYNPSKIEKYFENKKLEFLIICSQMPEAHLKEFSIKSIAILSDQEGGDLFLFELFKNPYFLSMKNFIITKLLRERKILETQEEFEQREKGEIIKAILQHIEQSILEAKSQLKPEEHLIELLNLVDLKFYQPFRAIFSFVDQHYNIPLLYDYPGFPLYCEKSDHIHFVTRVILNCSDLNQATLSTSEGRKLLLQCSEFLLLEYAHSFKLDRNKAKKWLAYFPEITEFPKIQSIFESLIIP